MSDFNIATVVKGFVARWTTNTSLSSAVPGGLAYERRKDVQQTPTASPTTGPYALLTVKKTGENEWITSALAQRQYLAIVTIYSGQAIHDAATLQQTLADTFDWQQQAMTYVTGTRFLSVEPSDETLEISELEEQAKDAVISRAAWLVTIVS